MTFIFIGGFLFSWLPYGLVSLYTALISSNGVEEFLATLPAMFAKSSLLWPTVLFIFSNKSIRKKLIYLRFSSSSQNNTTTSNKNNNNQYRRSFRKNLAHSQV